MKAVVLHVLHRHASSTAMSYINMRQCSSVGTPHILVLQEMRPLPFKMMTINNWSRM